MATVTPVFTSVRDVAQAARAFAQEVGLPNSFGWGSRGRVGANVYLSYLASSAPATVRQAASVVGVTIKPKSKISEDTLATVAIELAKPATKR